MQPMKSVTDEQFTAILRVGSILHHAAVNNMHDERTKLGLGVRYCCPNHGWSVALSISGAILSVSADEGRALAEAIERAKNLFVQVGFEPDNLARDLLKCVEIAEDYRARNVQPSEQVDKDIEAARGQAGQATHLH